jgi:hypothetical protein
LNDRFSVFGSLSGAGPDGLRRGSLSGQLNAARMHFQGPHNAPVNATVSDGDACCQASPACLLLFNARGCPLHAASSPRISSEVGNTRPKCRANEMQGSLSHRDACSCYRWIEVLRPGPPFVLATTDLFDEFSRIVPSALNRAKAGGFVAPSLLRITISKPSPLAWSYGRRAGPIPPGQ